MKSVIELLTEQLCDLTSQLSDVTEQLCEAKSRNEAMEKELVRLSEVVCEEDAESIRTTLAG